MIPVPIKIPGVHTVIRDRSNGVISAQLINKLKPEIPANTDAIVPINKKGVLLYQDARVGLNTSARNPAL